MPVAQQLAAMHRWVQCDDIIVRVQQLGRTGDVGNS